MSILLKIPAYSHRVGLLHTNTCSGVQRLFDARGANEVLGCPRIFSIFLVVHQNFSNSSHKITDDLFSHLPKFFSNSNLSLFRIRFQISRKFAPWMSPSAASYPGNDIFLFLFSHLSTFFTKTGPLNAHWGGCPGPSHRPHPLCTPLLVRRLWPWPTRGSQRGISPLGLELGQGKRNLFKNIFNVQVTF